MNAETTADYDTINAYIESAQQSLARARGQEAGTSYEAANLEEACLELQNALTVLGRALPSLS